MEVIMNHIEIYSKDNCPYCNKAKQLLTTMNIPFSEQKLDRDFTREILLERYPNAKTYPVVVVDGFHIGGYSQLVEKVNEQTSSTKQLLNEAR
jgi:glutaredoxin